MSSGQLQELVKNNEKLKCRHFKNLKWWQSLMSSVVIYERGNYSALTWKNLVFWIGDQSLLGGGRTWRFDCIKQNNKSLRDF